MLPSRARRAFTASARVDEAEAPRRALLPRLVELVHLRFEVVFAPGLALDSNQLQQARQALHKLFRLLSEAYPQ